MNEPEFDDSPVMIDALRIGCGCVFHLMKRNAEMFTVTRMSSCQKHLGRAGVLSWSSLAGWLWGELLRYDEIDHKAAARGAVRGGSMTHDELIAEVERLKERLYIFESRISSLACECGAEEHEGTGGCYGTVRHLDFVEDEPYFLCDKCHHGDHREAMR